MSNSLLTSSFDLAQACDWTRRFRQQSEHGVRGHLFSRDELEAVLAQPHAAGIRFYYGRDEQNQPRLVMVGVDAADNDLLGTADAQPLPLAAAVDGSETDTALTLSAATDTGIVGPGRTCPPCCGSGNALNG